MVVPTVFVLLTILHEEEENCVKLICKQNATTREICFLKFNVILFVSPNSFNHLQL